MHICTLKSVSGLPSLELPHGKTITIGRSPDTKIKSTSCSRTQLEVIPNCEAKFVTVKQIGPNESGINDKPIGHGLLGVAQDKDIINVVVSDATLNYQILFTEQPTPVKDIVEAPRDVSEAVVADARNGGPKPVKIPKMFLPKHTREQEFRKDCTAGRGTWEKLEGGKVLAYVCGDTIRDPKEEVCAFDMDGTLITTKSGRVFPKDEEDWKFLNESIVLKLRNHFHQNLNTKFVIITNQAWLDNPKQATKLPQFKTKIEKIVLQIGIPTVVFILTGKNEYRKPLPAIWDLYVSKFNGGVEPNKSLSKFCGDAAGRKSDHSFADRFFAENVGIAFNTPEEFFGIGKSLAYLQPKFDPKVMISKLPNISNRHIVFPFPVEMILMVGYPASGKTSYVKSTLVPQGYMHISRDILKTAVKCKTEAGKALAEGRSVVIDNTNPAVKDRQEYIQIAKTHDIPARCFVMCVEKHHALHNNKFRELVRDQHESVPETAFHIYANRFQEPAETEGFADIVKVNFIPSFDDEVRQQKYLMHLLEK